MNTTLIKPPQKVRTPVSKIPLLIAKDATRNKIDQATKKPTREQERRPSPQTNREEGGGHRPQEEGGGYRPQETIDEGKGYRPQEVLVEV